MTPTTRTAASAAVAAALTWWTTVDLPDVSWSTAAATWGILTAMTTGLWALIAREVQS